MMQGLWSWMRVDRGSKRSNSSNSEFNLNTDVSKLQLYVWVMVNMGDIEWWDYFQKNLCLVREAVWGMASFSVNCSSIWHEQMISGPEWNLVKCLLWSSPMPWKMKHLPPEINFSLPDQTQCTVYVLCNRNFKAHKFLRESLVSEKIHYFDLK